MELMKRAFSYRSYNLRKIDTKGKKMNKMFDISVFIAIFMTMVHAAPEIHYGKVLEVKAVMGYKYLEVDENGTRRWLAIASAPVKVGDRIGYDTQTVMKNFESKSLNRIFDEIIFTNTVYLPRKPIQARSMKEALHLEESKEILLPPVDVKDFVAKDVYTVAELYRYRTVLAGKKVSVKAKVRKVSRQIMKRDWVHLEDGTGTEAMHDNDIVFTSKRTSVKTGDSVVATGTIVIDKDFGYGYFYPVLGEEASFKVP